MLDASIGTTVVASSRDTAREKMTTSANWVKVCPVWPLIKSSGRKTIMTVNVEANTADTISCVPLTAASMDRFLSRSICRYLFSSTTMASSTIKPEAKASPLNDIVFKVNPQKYKSENVEIIDTGIES